MDERTSAWTPRVTARRGQPARDVIFQPSVHQRMQRGIDQVCNAIRPTLGPLPRGVAVTSAHAQAVPELLDSGGLIARRIIELDDRDADVGAMLARAMICRLHDEVGDGTATAATLMQSIYAQGIHYLASGGNAMRLRAFLEQGLQLVLDELMTMPRPVEGQAQLTQVAEAICHDRPLAQLLGEIFAVVGPYGQVDIRTGNGRELSREFVEGMTWPTGLFSRAMFTDTTNLLADVEDAAILVSDLTIDDPGDLMPGIVMALEAGFRSLVIVARKLSEPALAGIALANRQPDKLRLIAVRTPGTNPDDQATALEDLAVLTGATPLLSVTGQSLRFIQPSNLGKARRVWASTSNFGLIGGSGDQSRISAHVDRLQARFDAEETLDRRRRLQQRISRFVGGSATLWIGASTRAELDMRKALAERSADLLRGVLLFGALPGGGVALLACRPALQEALRQSVDPDERAAYRILVRALAEPARVLIANAGYESDAVMADVNTSGSGIGFDVITGEIVSVVERGILDSADVLHQAVFSAVSSAALALTIDVFVHHRHRQLTTNPG